MSKFCCLLLKNVNNIRYCIKYLEHLPSQFCRINFKFIFAYVSVYYLQLTECISIRIFIRLPVAQHTPILPSFIEFLMFWGHLNT